jgi:hypothetical protein
MEMNLDYDLIFHSREAAKASGSDAELLYERLDPRLCRGRSVPIVLEGTYAAQDRRLRDGTLTLESVQFRSIEAFLREQATVRQAVEADMTEARQHWLGIATRDVAEMWSDTMFSALYLPTRELIAIEGGGPEVVSAYSVIFNVGWDPEHGTRALKFRDGVQIGFGMAGD